MIEDLKEDSQSLAPVEPINGETQEDAFAELKTNAQEYGQRISNAAAKAKDYLSERATAVGEKVKELQSKDLSEITEDAKEYARKNPGKTIAISVAAGFLLGLLIRAGRR
jgi:ElaB/YqjD/DUF883 family membrane-anchored ribosome-binding protein